MEDIEQTEKTRAFFDSAASGWTTRYERDPAVDARKTRFLKAIAEKFQQPIDILDFGCGSGDITLHLSTTGHRMVGYDLSAAMIDSARRNDHDGRVKWIVRSENDADSLPVSDRAFDVVIASSVLEYLPDIETTLKEMSRVLRPGGWLFATVPDMRDARRKREHWLRMALRVPGVAWALDKSRWREGFAYLRISANRMEPDAWRRIFLSNGFHLETVPDAAGPLLMLAAKRIL